MHISTRHIYTESETWTLKVKEGESVFLSWMPRRVNESETEGLWRWRNVLTWLIIYTSILAFRWVTLSEHYSNPFKLQMTVLRKSIFSSFTWNNVLQENCSIALCVIYWMAAVSSSPSLKTRINFGRPTLQDRCARILERGSSLR